MGEGAAEMMQAMLDNMPLSTMVTFGMLTQEQLSDILSEINPQTSHRGDKKAT